MHATSSHGARGAAMGPTSSEPQPASGSQGFGVPGSGSSSASTSAQGAAASLPGKAKQTVTMSKMDFSQWGLESDGFQRGTNGGIVHDALWCKAALAFLNVLTAALRNEGLPPQVLSLGPASRGRDALVHALTDIVNPDPDLCMQPGDVGAFDFKDSASSACATQDVDVQPSLAGESGIAKLDRHGVFFFSLHRFAPSAAVTLRGAPSISDLSHVSISMLDVQHFQFGQRRVEVFSEGRDGNAAEMCLLAAGSLDINDFAKLHVWAESGLRFSFGFPIEKDFEDAFHDVVSQLLHARGNADVGRRHYTLALDEDGGGKRVAGLEAMKDHGCAACIAEDARSQSWVLTEKGEQNLISTRLLSSPKPVLRPRPDVNLLQREPFELAFMLHQQKWICSVKPKGRRAKQDKKKGAEGAKDAVPMVQEYTRGSERRWWLGPAQTNFRTWYMRALLAAAMEKEEAEKEPGLVPVTIPLPHFATESFYECLLTGKKHVRKRKFKFSGEPVPRRRKRVAKAAAASAVGTPSVPDGEQVADSDSDSDSASRASSCKSSSRSSRPSGSSGSSSSSESSASEAGGSEKPATSEKGSAAGLPRLNVGHLASTTHFWKGFKFTVTKDRNSGEGNGWEVTCYAAEHNAKGQSRCTRTMSHAVGGGPEQTLLKLRWWCAEGLCSHIATKAAHTELPRHGPAAGLPSMSDLERCEPRPEAQA